MKEEEIFEVEKEEEEGSSLGNLLIGIVGIAALLALVAILIAVCFYTKKKRDHHRVSAIQMQDSIRNNPV